MASILFLLDVHKLHWLLSCKTVMLYCTVDLLLWKFIVVLILTGRVQQHCWHYTVGKFVCACFIQLSVDLSRIHASTLQLFKHSNWKYARE